MLHPAARRINPTIARVDSGCQKFMMLFVVVVIFQRVTEEFKSFVTPKSGVHRKRQIPLAFIFDESDVSYIPGVISPDTVFVTTQIIYKQ